MLAFINPNANNGVGLKRWQRLKAELDIESTAAGYCEITDAVLLPEQLEREASQGDGRVIAVGGDGTVNHVVNRIMNLDDDKRKRICLGAVGVGSSNDFHKPMDMTRMLRVVPVRLDWNAASLHNIGRIDYMDEAEVRRQNCFIINCSIGIVAQANYIFNRGSGLVSFLKGRWLNGAIVTAGLRALFSARNIPARIIVNDTRIETEITNLSVFLNPHVSGSFRYDFETAPGEDSFGVALAEGMNVARRLRLFIALAGGRFSGLPGTRSWFGDKVEIQSETVQPLEMDGEVCMAKDIRISLIKDAIWVCG